MIKQAMAEVGLESFAVAGLVLFVAVFVAITAWALSRSRRQIDTWSSLPLADGTDPVEPRTPPGADNALNVVSKAESCGKCVDCTC